MSEDDYVILRGPSSSQGGSDPVGGAPLDERFWLVLHEPGNVPQRKGPWPRSEIKAVLREFMAARPTAYIDVLTLEHDGPNVRHGPEVLQILDGRSMGVGRRHNAQTRAAHAEAHAAIAKTVRPTTPEAASFICPRCGTDCRPNGDPHLGTCAGPTTPSAPPPHKMMG